MKLNLGCGSNWKDHYPEYEGLDITDYGQKFVVDVLHFFMGGVPKIQFVGKYDEVMANHFLEHFNQNELKDIFWGVHECLKLGGLFRITVPHMDRPEAWYLVHKTFFNEATFWMFNRTETDSYDEFGRWKVLEVIVNNKKNIHALLQKV